MDKFYTITNTRSVFYSKIYFILFKALFVIINCLVVIRALQWTHNNISILDFYIYFRVQPNVNQFDTWPNTIQIDLSLLQI